MMYFLFAPRGGVLARGLLPHKIQDREDIGMRRKPFGKPRPAGKGRTSTTTSTGQPRPGAGGKPRTGKPGGRPPAKGGFKSGGFKPGANRPGGFGPPKRKPRHEGDEG